MDPSDPDKKEVRRPMNAFLIFCKRHRSMVREKNPNLDNRNVTRILGDLWANLKEEEKMQYTDLAKQYKDAFMKANPDYKWHNPEKGMHPAGLLPKSPIKESVDFTRLDQTITPGKLADPSNMGGLSLLFMAGQQNAAKPGATSQSVLLPKEKMPCVDSGKTSSCGPNMTLAEQDQQSSEKEDKGTMVASGKMVMDSIIDQLYYSKSDTSSDFEGEETKKGAFTSITDTHKGRSLLHDLSVSRDELERKLLLNQQMNIDSGMEGVERAKSSLVDPRNAMLANHALIKSQMMSWSGYKRKRCYSEGFKDTPEMNTIQPFVNPYYKKSDSNSDVVDEDGDGDFQPVRKSKRRNRGQRYQELINEGIIQPSKERQTNSKSPEEAGKGEQRAVQKESEFREEERIDLNPRGHLGFDVLSVYPRQIRKRTQSESEKVRLEDSSRYKTGDFDLEAHIATLPACSLEKVAKPKKTTPKPRTMSESRTSSISSDSSLTTEIKLTIPPHLKVKAEDIPSEPVIGSRKRKARKHSITHLMPITVENKKEIINTDEESLKPTMKEMKYPDNGMTHFTEIKEPKESKDSEFCNNSSENNNPCEAKQFEDDSCIEPAVSESKVPDVASQSSDNQDNYTNSNSYTKVTTTEVEHCKEGLEDLPSSDEVGNGSVPPVDSSLNSEEVVKKTNCSLPEVVSLVNSTGPGVDVNSTRECSDREAVDFDNLGKQCGTDKTIAENVSVDLDNSKLESGDNYLKENEVKDEWKKDSTTDKDPCPPLNSASKTDTRGLSQSNLGQACGSQVSDVLSFHLEDTRDERSQVTIQNSPLQTAVVNS